MTWSPRTTDESAAPPAPAPAHAPPPRLAGAPLMSRLPLRTLGQRLADTAIVRPAAYLVRKLGFRQDVITRVNFLAAEDSAKYVLDKMMPCGVYDDRYPLFDLALRRAPAEGLVL